jgi:hypothetical protein
MMAPVCNSFEGFAVLTSRSITLALAVAALCATSGAEATPAAQSAAQPAAKSVVQKSVAQKPAPHGPNCKDLAFSVNDYGKEGPTRDAEALLDKHIEQWAKDEQIKKYKVGKKTTNCELYLDVGLFDEYTCKATANVCWGK